MSDETHPNSSNNQSSGSDRDALKNKLLNPKHWIRLLLMVLMFIILFTLVKFILSIALIVQWALVLFTGEPNARLLHFTKGLNRYGYQIMEFISYNSELKPFPLSDWPESNE